jgi:hypothetical protein
MNVAELRSHRIGGIALFDLVTGAIGSVLLLLIARYFFFKELRMMNFVLAGILLTIPIGIAFHILTGRNTMLNYKLGLSYKPE